MSGLHYSLYVFLSLYLPLFCKDSSAQNIFQILDDSYTTGENTAFLKVVTNTVTGAKFSILLNGGGGVDELFLAPNPKHMLRSASSPKNASLREVIWSHGRNATAVKLNPTWKGRLLIPYANRVADATYSWNGTQYHLPINDVAGLNNSLHGLLWNQTMKLVATNIDDSHGANITLQYDFNKPGSSITGAGYPFQLRVKIVYSLLLSGRFEITVNAENTDLDGGWPLPFYNGWHPYFLCHPCSEASVILDQRNRKEPASSIGPWRHVDVAVGAQFPPPRHSNMVPTTHTSPWHKLNGSAPIGPATDPDSPPGAPLYMDEEVKATQSISTTDFFATELLDPNTAQRVILYHDSAMHFLQIFTGALASFPNEGVDAIVLEPLSAMSDAFNNGDGLHIISAGETYTSRFAVEVA